VWNKVKEFLKKYWGYIASFALGALAYLSFDTNRNKRIDENLSELRNKLQEYKYLNIQFAERIKELEQRIVDVQDTSERASGQSLKLRNEIIGARENAERIANQVDTVIEHAYGIDTVTDELSRESKGIEQGLDRLKEFIEKYTEKTEVD
jgi:methyl-accepting chemotaxis protein